MYNELMMFRTKRKSTPFTMHMTCQKCRNRTTFTVDIEQEFDEIRKNCFCRSCGEFLPNNEIARAIHMLEGIDRAINRFQTVSIDCISIGRKTDE